nr:MAG TPA: repressor protein [Bacteriophage sp.]
MPRKKSITTDSYDKIFPKRLRGLMETKNATQQELGEYLKKTRQAIGYYADGSSSPDWETLVKIARYFKVSTDYLLGLTDTPALNADIRQVADYTGLWGIAISALHTKKEDDLNESLAEFLSYLATREETATLVQAIKNLNSFIGSSQKCKIDCGISNLYKMPMDSLMKAVIEDIFWKILEDYNVKPNEILLERRVSNGSNHKAD